MQHSLQEWLTNSRITKEHTDVMVEMVEAIQNKRKLLPLNFTIDDETTVSISSFTAEQGDLNVLKVVYKTPGKERITFFRDLE